MRQKTKLQYERGKRLGLFVAGMILMSILVFGVSFIKTSFYELPLTATDFLCSAACTLLVFTLLFGYLLAANDSYRVNKQEIIIQDGQMPFSKTYFVAQHLIYWWVNCRHNGKTVRFKTKKEADNYIQRRIEFWNSPLQQ